MATATLTKLHEQVLSESALTVDEEAGVIRGVKILGRESANGRTYSDKAMNDAAKLYEGRKVNVDHPDRANPNRERGFLEGVGELHDVTVKPGVGVYGDLHYLKSHPAAGTLAEAASRFPKSFGLSHNADGELNPKTKVVESIAHVESVDIVGKPATNIGLFESEDTDMAKTKTVKQILESKPATKWLAPLTEMVDAGVVDPGMEVPEAPDPAEEVKAALEKAAAAVLKKLFAGEIEQDAAFAEIKKIIGMKDEAAGDDAAGETAAPAADAVPESVSKKLAVLEAKTMLLEANRDATEERVAAVAAVPEASRKALVESWPAKGASNWAQRPASSPGVNNGGGQTTQLQEAEDRWNKRVERARQKLNA